MFRSDVPSTEPDSCARRRQYEHRHKDGRPDSVLLISSKRYSTPEVGLDGPIFFVSLADCWKPLSAVGPPMNSVGASLRGSDDFDSAWLRVPNPA